MYFFVFGIQVITMMIHHVLRECVFYVFKGIEVKHELAYRDCYGQDHYHHPGHIHRVDGPLPTYQRRGSLQLWQFLVALLDDPGNSAFIAWTGRGLEFKLIEPEEVKTQ